jgi:predicted DNA repair protein MutK
MAASSLLALIDDITTLLDDVALLTKVAAAKTTGVMGDDLALNAEQVAGVSVDRELPVVWAVAKGSLLNKLILVPAALAISAFIPAAITPLLMIGGLFLCYEGFEKVAHKWLHRADPPAATPLPVATATAVAAGGGSNVDGSATPTPTPVDPVAFEKDKVKGAVRTDFVLSAEIIVITLGTMATAPLSRQIVALSLVALAATVLVYGLVAGIVKLDDLGLALSKRSGSGAKVQRSIGAFILRAAPRMMKALSIVGTIAMFTVGGSILAHGIPVVAHALHDVGAQLDGMNTLLSTLVTTTIDAIVGVASGGVALGIVTFGQRLFTRRPAASA